MHRMELLTSPLAAELSLEPIQSCCSCSCAVVDEQLLHIAPKSVATKSTHFFRKRLREDAFEPAYWKMPQQRQVEQEEEEEEEEEARDFKRFCVEEDEKEIQQSLDCIETQLESAKSQLQDLKSLVSLYAARRRRRL